MSKPEKESPGEQELREKYQKRDLDCANSLNTDSLQTHGIRTDIPQIAFSIF